MYYYYNTQKTAFSEVVEQRQKNSKSSSTEFSLRNIESNTKVQIEGTNTELHYDDQDSFGKLKKDADKLLVRSTRLGNISGLCICGERTKQVRFTAGNEGHHPSPSSGVLTSIFLEPGWIVRISEAQLTATELKKCKDLADSLESVEFGYRTVEDCKVLYRFKGEGTQLVLPKHSGFYIIGFRGTICQQVSWAFGCKKDIDSPIVEGLVARDDKNNK